MVRPPAFAERNARTSSRIASAVLASACALAACRSAQPEAQPPPAVPVESGARVGAPMPIDPRAPAGSDAPAVSDALPEPDAPVESDARTESDASLQSEAPIAPETQGDPDAPNRFDFQFPTAAKATEPVPEPPVTTSAPGAATTSTPQAATTGAGHVDGPQRPTSPDAPFLVGSDALEPDESLAIHGTLSAQLRARASGGAHDVDAYGLLALDVGTPGTDRVTGHLLARLSTDVDGRGDDESQSVFGSLQDVDGDAVVLDLYEASAEIDRPFDAPLRARIGRQLDYQTPAPAHYDGLRAESEPLGGSKIVAGAYAGIPVRIYDGDSTGNQIAGAFGEAQPWTGGRVRADWMYVHQEADTEDFRDSLLGLSLWQRLSHEVAIDAGYTRLEQEDRDVRVRATYDDGEGDLAVQLGWIRLLQVQRQFADEFDPYFTTLWEQEPYDQYRLLVSKALGDDVRLDVGGDVRRLEDADTEGQFNHDYERAYATGVVSGVTAIDLALSLTADFWNSDDRDVQTWGLDVTWEPERAWRLSAGSAYALYKYDLAQGSERDDVRVWYARARREVGAAWTLDLGLEFEDDDFDDYAQILAGATWRF